MIKFMSAAALVAATLAAAPAIAAPGDSYRAQAYQDPYSNQNRGQNDYNANPAFTQGCPQGAIPESWPNGSGRRCALPNGGYSY